jgi:hypothetical protein
VKLSNDEEFIIVGKDTGIIHGTLDPGVSITTESQRNSFKKYLQMINNKGGAKFTNTNIDKIDFVTKHLTNNQIGYLVMLQPFVNYDGYLVKGQKRKERMKGRDMKGVLGLQRKRNVFSRFHNRCIELSILELDDNGYYKMNPEIIFKGEFKALKVVSAISKSVKDMTSNLQPADLAILFKLQKHIHWSSMALVHNPDEFYLEDITPLNTKDLVEVLEVSADYIYRKFTNLKINGEYLIATVKAGKNKRYMMNPKIFFRGNYEDVQESVTNDNEIYFKV